MLTLFSCKECDAFFSSHFSKAPTGKWFKDGSNGWCASVYLLCMFTKVWLRRDHGLVIINFEKSSDLQLGSSATSLEKCG
jgi:hypothetical protein